MKRGFKKAISAGMAGLTALSSVPVNAFAYEDVSNYIERNLIEADFEGVSVDVDGVNTTLDFINGWYYSPLYNRMYFCDESKALISIDNEGASGDYKVTDVKVIKGASEEVTLFDYDSTTKFFLGLVLTKGEDLVIKYTLEDSSGGSKEVEVPVNDYIMKAYPSFSGYAYSSVTYKDSYLEESGTTKTSIGDYYVKNGIVTSVLELSGVDEGIDIDASAKLSLTGADGTTEVDMDSSYISIERDTVDTSVVRVRVNVPVSDDKLGLDNFEGSVKVSTTFVDSLGVTHSLDSDSFLIDNKEVEVKLVPYDSFVGADGKTYIAETSKGSGQYQFYLYLSDWGHGGYRGDIHTEAGLNTSADDVFSNIYKSSIPKISNIVTMVTVSEDFLKNPNASIRIDEPTLRDIGVNSEIIYSIRDVFSFDYDNAVFGVPDTVSSIDIVSDSPTVEYDGKTWYKGNTTVKLSSQNVSGYKTLQSLVAGKWNAYDGKTTMSMEEEYNLADMTSNSANGIRFGIKTTTQGLMGSSLFIDETYYYDGEAPVLNNIGMSVTADELNVADGVAYYTGDITIGGTVSDDITGVKSLEVLKDGAVVSNTLPYTITDSGAYSVRVVDNIDNERTYSLGDFIEGLEFDSVVIVEDSPVIGEFALDGAVSLDGVDYAVGYDISGSVKVDGTAIEKLEVYVDGSLDKTIYGDFSKEVKYVSGREFTDGNHTLTFKAYNRVGVSVEKEYVFRIDASKPVIDSFNSSSVGVESVLGSDEFTVYDSNPTFTFVANDGVTTGVEKYVLRRYENGTLAETLENTDGVFSNINDGTYTVEVVDRVGNTTGEVSLEDYGVHEVVIDNVKSEVSLGVTEGGNSVTLDNGIVAYSSDVKVDWVARDTWLSSVSVLNNDEVLSAHSNIRGSLSESKVFGVAEGTSEKFSIGVYAEDLFGNTAEDSVEFYIDRTAPEFTSKFIDKSFNNRSDGLYFKEMPTISVEASDDLVGVDRFELVDGTGAVVETNTSGVFQLKDGEYSIRVVDRLGNATVKTVQELLGLDSNSIIIDSDMPVITVDRGTGLDGWFSTDIEYSVKAEDTNLDMAEVTVNGTYSDKKVNIQGTSTTITFNTADIEDDDYKYDVVIRAVDKAGNEFIKTDVVYVDMDEPVGLGASVSGKHIDRRYGVFFSEVPEVSLSAEDSGIGLDKYTLTSSDGTENTKADGVFRLQNGSYLVRVADKLGNATSDVTLASLLGWTNNDVYVDNTKPAINTSRPTGDLDGWYSEDFTYAAYIGDDLNIHSAKLFINDVEVDSFVANSLGNTGVVLVANTDGAYTADGYTYNIRVEAVDSSGNTEVYEDVFYIDRSAPEIKGVTINGEYSNLDHGIYFKGNASIDVTVEDSGVGLASVVLVDADGNRVLGDGHFELSEGSYSIYAVDKLGNETAVSSLKDLCGLNSNEIILDKGEPVVELERAEGLDGLWYGDDIEYTVRLSDETSIESAEVRVNGIVVDSIVGDGTIKDKTVTFNSSSIGAKDGYYYDVEVVLSDSAGNTVVKTDRFAVDRSAPVVESGNILGSKVGKPYGVYFKSEPSLGVVSRDSGVGIEKYILVDKDGNVVSSTSGMFTLGTNEYFVKVVDRLGNVSDVVSVKDLVGLSSNSVVIDEVKPVIKSSRPEGSINGWFSEDVVYSVELSDNIGIYSAKVTINGVEVDSFVADSGNVTAKSLKADTSKVSANADGSYTVRVELVDNAGNTADSWSDTIYIDRSAPVVEKFVIQGQGYKEGVETNGSDKYGFYLKDATNVEVHVTDGDVTSGMKELRYTLRSEDGTSNSYVTSISGGIANISIPKDFKGFISAYAVDMVGNIGSENRPDGIITESSNTHVNSSKVEINLSSTDFTDSKGNFLYRGNVVASAVISDDYSGIRSIRWGIGSQEVGTVSVDNSGNISGDVNSIKGTDKNLVIDLEKALSVTNNENDINVWVEVMDRAGYVSRNNRVISIDKDVPVIDVTYNEYLSSDYYDSTRTATVRITERNFRSGDVVFNGILGTVGNWVYEGNDTWVNTVTFAEDGDYQWSVNYTDMAGNVAQGYGSEKFTIDKINPVVDVTFDNNSYENGNFFKEGRTATVRIVEHNFDPNLVSVSGNVSISGWSSEGDVHVATISVQDDGEYSFTLSVADRSGNTSNVFDSGTFIIDKGEPTLNIVGVQNGVSYKNSVGFTVSLGDSYIDTSRTIVKLVSRANGDMELVGELNEETGEFTFKGVGDDAKFDDLYTLTAVVYDKAGNVSEETVTFSINRYGSSYDFVNNGLLGAVVSEAEDVVLVEYSVDRLDISSAKVVVIKDGVEIDVSEDLVSISESGGVDGKWAYTYTVNKSAFKEDGMYQVQVYSKAVDGTDNSSLAQEYFFMLDSTNPEIIVSGVESGEAYNEVAKTVTIDVRDLSGVSLIEVLLNGEKVDVAEKDGIYSLTVNERSKTQNLVVRVVDNAGNESVVEISDFLVTSNIIQTALYNPFVRGIVGAVGLFIAFIIYLLFRRRREDKKKEYEMAQEHARLYRDSTTGSSSSSSGTENNE